MAANPTLVREAPASARAESAADGAALLYERYYDRVFGYCLYQLGSREEAEDVTQTTFMWAFRGLRRGVVPRAEAARRDEANGRRPRTAPREQEAAVEDQEASSSTAED